MDALRETLTGALGPFGMLIAVGLLGVVLIGVALSLIMAEKRDPLEKLKRTRARSNTREVKQKLRSKQHNEQLERYANFLEPQTRKSSRA